MDKEKVKEMFNRGRHFLMKNDIQSFYENLIANGYDIGYIQEATELFMRQKIDLIGLLRDAVPAYMFYDMLVPGQYIDDGILQLPDKIKTICEEAFAGVDNIYAINLDGIEKVESGAFENSSIQFVTITDMNTKINRDAFLDCNFTLYVPEGEAEKAKSVYNFVGCKYTIEEY